MQPKQSHLSPSKMIQPSVGFQEYQMNNNKKRQYSTQSSRVQATTLPLGVSIDNNLTFQEQQPISTTSTAIICTTATPVESQPRRQRKNEAVCAICEKGGDMLLCDGTCLRSFHLECLGLDSLPEGPRWDCDDCSSQQNTCFACGHRGFAGVDLMKCKVHQCGKYYHIKCVSKFGLSKVVNTKSPRFNCPLHYCAKCGLSGDGKQSIHCFRCPKAYHVTCTPAGVRMLTKSKETRKTGLVLCGDHHPNDPIPSKQIGNTLHQATNTNGNQIIVTHTTPAPSKLINDLDEVEDDHCHHQEIVQPQLIIDENDMQLRNHNNHLQYQYQQAHPQPQPPPQQSFIYNSPSSVQSTPTHSGGASPMSSPNVRGLPYDYIISAPSSPIHPHEFNYNHHNSNNNNLGEIIFPSKLLKFRNSSNQISSNAFVPSISTAPSPALSRSNSSENLCDELTSLASSLVSIRDRHVEQQQRKQFKEEVYIPSSSTKRLKSLENSYLVDPIKLNNNNSNNKNNQINNNNNISNIINTFDENVNESRLLATFFDFGSKNLSSAPTTPKSNDIPFVPSYSSSTRLPTN